MTVCVLLKDIRHQFDRAHDCIIEQLGGPVQIWRAARNNSVSVLKFLEQAWEKQYNVKVFQSTNGSWNSIEFPSDQHFLLFLMKWS
jgi:hypothetical protein